MNLNAIRSQSRESKEINNEHDELKSREKENLEVFNALQNMFKDLELDWLIGIFVNSVKNTRIIVVWRFLFDLEDSLQRWKVLSKR